MGYVAPSVVLLLGALACGQPHREEYDRCLPLPPAVRHSLIAAPGGKSLYWLERTRDYDFDADLDGSWHLVRYDIRTRRADVVLEHAAAPIQFIRDQLLALRSGEESRLVVLPKDGAHTQELTPPYMNVRDFEVVDHHTIAFLADGVGARAVYTVSLRELRPYHLIDADILLSASPGRVFAVRADDVIVVDVNTRATKQLPYIKKSIPLDDSLVYVDHENVVVHSMMTNGARPGLMTKRDWKLHHQLGSVLARTKPANGKSFASLVMADGVRELPVVVGGASIVAATRLRDQTWALIAHNTSNFVGDLAQTAAETDVCLLPAASEVTFPTRQVPARYASYADPLFKALDAQSPAATLQIVEDNVEPVTVSIHLKKEFGARDLEGMRKRTRELHERVTSLLHDPEVRTEVVFADRRVGLHRWRRDRGRYRTTVGMGDALMSNAADFDFEVAELENEKRDDKITCTGKLRNLTRRDLTDVDVQCSGNRNHRIRIDRLAVDEARAFSQTFDVSPDGEVAYVEVIVAGKPSEPRKPQWEDGARELFTLATDVYAATGLWLEQHDVGADEIVVSLNAEEDFLRRDRAAQETAIMNAYSRYETLRTIYGIKATTPLRVTVDLELTDARFEYDGSKLVRD